MTENTQRTATTTSSAVASQGGLASTHGATSIADTVVAKIAGIATRDLSGVHALGGNAARAVGAIRERIPGGRVNHSQGVSVEVGEKQAAVDIELIAEYGVAIADLASAVRRNVITSVERMTGLEVTEVNITVSDVHLPEDDQDDEVQTTRVQ
ncbi:Asp23/Gls24 family envelope stress response protein [Kineococcus gynurae]|uniref:Asp23/Gls24 family envelope stress response protein n=1 Tax=Kineococcus gynurae TaxID=452979 RepID=A0ABV5LRH3_9ACTN